MICDKCGKSNIKGLTVCHYCGAEMPKLTGGGGFADILSYKDPSGEIPMKSDTAKESDKTIISEQTDLEIHKILKKTDAVMNLTKRNLLCSLLCVVISFLVLSSSIILETMTIRKLKNSKKEVMSQIEEVEKELKNNNAEADDLIEKKGLSQDKKIEESDKEDTTIEEIDAVNENENTDEKVKNPSPSKTDVEGKSINH